MRRRRSRLLCSWVTLFLLLAAGCSRRAAPPEAVFGDLKAAGDEPALSAQDLAPYLAFSRAVIAGQDRPPAPGLEKRTGRRVFLTVHHPGSETLVTTGRGDTLQDSVLAAGQLARSSRSPLEEMRIQLDVVESVELDEFSGDIRPEPGEVGRFGYVVAPDAKKLGFLLPGEIVSRELYDPKKKGRLKRKKIEKLLASRARIKVADLAAPFWRIETVSVVESAPPGRALPLYRGMVERKEKLTAEELFTSVRSGADYLVRILEPNGRYIYNYKAIEDRPFKDSEGLEYNMLRHCGTTYALLEAYEHFQDPRYLEAAERAIGYMYGRLRPRPDWVQARAGVGDFLHIVDEDKAEMSKLGGAGLALITLSKHAALTGQATHLETMRAIARYVQHMQEDNGHFLSYFQWKKDRPVKQKEILYYPGEAILGLMRLYAHDPDPRWLETAKKAADYLIFTRDASKTEDNIEHDHWLSYGLNELYRVTKNRAYADHAFKIARAIIKKQKSRSEAPAPDFVGGFYKIPGSTPASVRLEAFYADITLARYLGESETSLVDAAHDVAAFVKAQQFDEQNAFFLPDPAMAHGGVRENLLYNDIRIDYVQHAMSGWLGFARTLQDPTFGKTGEPAVLPVKPLKGGPPAPAIGVMPVVASPAIGAPAGGPAVVAPAGQPAKAEDRDDEGGSEAGGGEKPAAGADKPAGGGEKPAGGASGKDREAADPEGEE